MRGPGLLEYRVVIDEFGQLIFRNKGSYFPSAFNSSPVLPPCLRRSLLENFESVEMLLEVNPSHVYEFNLTASSFKLPELAPLIHTYS